MLEAAQTIPLASHLSVAVAVALLFGVARSVPRSVRSQRWAIIAIPIVGLQLAILMVWAIGTVSFLPWLERFGSVATVLLFAWPLLIPIPNSRWDALLLGVDFALVIALAASLGVDSLRTLMVLPRLWGSLGLVFSVSIAIGMAIRRPERWPFFFAGYIVLSLGFLGGTWAVPTTLPLVEMITYPVMTFLVMGVLIHRAKAAEPRTPVATFSKALNQFEEALQPETLTHSGLRLIAQFLQARYGLIIWGPDQSGGLTLAAAVDTNGLREPAGPPLRSTALPEITSSLVRGRAKVLRKEDEVRAVREVLGLDPSGEAMIAPTMLVRERPGGLLLFAGIKRPNWTPADLEILEGWASYLGRSINRRPDVAKGSPSEDAEILRGELRLALQELAEISAVESGDSMAQVGTLTSLLTEMRAPIASIQHHNEMLRGGAIGALYSDQQKLLEHIRQDAAQLDRQLTDLLNLVKAPPGEVQSQIELRNVVDIAQTQVDTDLRQSGIELKRELPDSLPPVEADSDLLRQVIVMLFERAIRISPSDSQIRIAAQVDESGWVSIAVSDQGPGVPAEDLGRLFRPGATSEGSEFGLIKALTDSLGGRVWVGSEMGVGSTVTVLIPASEGTVADAS